MARKKVNLAWIANNSTRRATLKKRSKGLVKKVSELSTLCDVKACLVVYEPQESLPVVWPSVHEAARLVARFRSMPEMEQSKKMMNQEGFLQQRVVKLQDQLRKNQRENREIQTTLLMYEGLAGRSLHNVGMEEVASLAWMLEMRMKMVQQRIEMLTAQMAEPSSHSTEASRKAVPPVAPLVQGPMPVIKEKTAMEAAMEALQTPNWFGDVMDPNGNMMHEMVQPYVDNTNPWLHPYYFPFN
ncbi:agamous-like MADS-box protein AGL80 [Elaeis guineensis]|uniref:agamous-like MADS-box protein AGL80 n=1 Tax=Elaeis guineensis var. tenera TaxID=51953 RepID=UPI003C6D8323